MIKDQCLDVGDSMYEQCWASHFEKVIIVTSYFFKKSNRVSN